MRFRIRPHSDPLGNRPDAKVVEVYDDENRFIGMLTHGRQGDEEVRFISKHVKRVVTDSGPITAVNIALARSADEPKPVEWEDVAGMAAVMNLQRVMMFEPKRLLGILVKKTTFEILPADTTLEEAAGTNGMEIIAVVENLAVPSHVTKDGPATDTSSTRAAEGTIDVVFVRCDACGQEFDEERWIGAEDRCPSCGKIRLTDS